MKKLLTLLLGFSMLLALASCGGKADNPPEVPGTQGEYYLEEVSGWWTVPAGFQEIALLYTFHVDPINCTATSYDDHGSVIASYTCWYDEYGFSIDTGDERGVITYLLFGDQLLDEAGYVCYERCDPMTPGDMPYTMEMLAGNWYKNGGDTTYLILTEEGYRLMQEETMTDSGLASLTNHTIQHDVSEHSGPVVALESALGLTSTLWVLEDGKVLYDDFHGDYYIKTTVPIDEAEKLSQSYAITRDEWYTGGENGHTLDFKFFGSLWLYTPGESTANTCVSVGTWAVSDDRISIIYADGTTQEIPLSAKELVSDYLNLTFARLAM